MKIEINATITVEPETSNEDTEKVVNVTNNSNVSVSSMSDYILKEFRKELRKAGVI